MMNEATYCVTCGLAIEARWAFCPGCGSQRVDLVGRTRAESTATTASPAADLTKTVRLLLEGQRWDEAESLLRSHLEGAPDTIVRLQLAEVLLKTHRVAEAGELLDAAVTSDPADPMARLQRAQYRARLGFCDTALEDVRVAQRYLTDDDVRLLVFVHELERTLMGQVKYSFVRRAPGPRLPRWLKRGTEAEPRTLASDYRR